MSLFKLPLLNLNERNHSGQQINNRIIIFSGLHVGDKSHYKRRDAVERLIVWLLISVHQINRLTSDWNNNNTSPEKTDGCHQRLRGIDDHRDSFVLN